MNANFATGISAAGPVKKFEAEVVIMNAVFDFNTAARQDARPARNRAHGVANPAAAFREFLLSHGLHPDDSVVPTGNRVQRCPVDDDKPGRTSGWYVFYVDGLPAGEAGDWRTGESWTWCAKEKDSLSLEELKIAQAHLERSRKVREQERARLAAEAAARAERDWSKAAEAAAHPYLSQKDVSAYGLKMAAGKLLVPVKDTAGALRSLQFIDADGNKKFLFGGATAGCFHRIPGTNDVVAVAEGYATAASIHMATGWTVLTAFNAGNLLPVARAWRDAHPGCRMVICGDDDCWKGGWNIGRKKAEACAKEVGGVALFPSFAAGEGEPTDWNDLHRREGLEEVKRQLLGSECDNRHFLYKLHADGPYPTEKYTRQTPPDLQWAFKDAILMGSPFVLCGAGGTGKTSVSLQLAASLATGRALLGPVFTPERRGRSIVLLCEDPEAPIWQRVHHLGHDLEPDELKDFNRMANIQSCLGEEMRLVRDGPTGLATTETFDALLDLARRTPDLATIILDPLNLLHGADVERNEEAAQFFSSKLAWLGKQSGAAVIVVHHSVKNSTGRGERFNLEEALHVDNIRGSGAIVNGMRGACNLVVLPSKEAKKQLGLAAMPKPGEYLAGKVSKINYAAQSDTFYLRRDDNGLLHPVQPRAAAKSANLAVDVMPRVCAQVAKLAEEGKQVTQRMFIRIYAPEWNVTQKLLNDAIERAFFEGWLEVLDTLNDRGGKVAYLVTGDKYIPPSESQQFDFNQ